jgi:hypothetical protein
MALAKTARPTEALTKPSRTNEVWILNPSTPNPREWVAQGIMIRGNPVRDLRYYPEALKGKRSGINTSAVTYKSRRSVPTVAAWKSLPAIYDGNKLIIDGFQVMRSDENSYMEHLVRVASAAGGNTLEVGLGMGIATKMFLRRREIKHHTVIELNADVIKKMRQDPIIAKAEAANRLTILEGDWKNVVGSLIRHGKKFDGILFDTYPLKRGKRVELHANHYPFFPYAKKCSLKMESSHIILTNRNIFPPPMPLNSKKPDF